jgi:hypothetical protein
MEILWSDPNNSEDAQGLVPNLIRDPQKQNGMTLFGSDVVEKFLKVN